MIGPLAGITHAGWGVAETPRPTGYCVQDSFYRILSPKGRPSPQFSTSEATREPEVDPMLQTRARLLLITTALIVAGAGSAAAQFPDAEAQLTLSASSTELIQEITVENGDEFWVEVVVAPMPGEEKVQFDAKRFHWSILEACCGSAVLLQEVVFDPDYTHEGHPFAGVISTAESCLDRDMYHLASIRLAIDAPEPGIYLVLLYPLDLATDCADGGRSLFGTGINIVVDTVAAETSSWSTVKGLYR